ALYLTWRRFCPALFRTRTAARPGGARASGMPYHAHVGTVPRPQRATVDDALARPEHERVELIRGTLVQKAAPTGEHSDAQIHLGRGVGDRFDRRPGGRW